MTTYTTNLDAIAAIREALGEHADQHDLDAIFDEAYAYDPEAQGFVQTVDTDEFWAIVERHARTLRAEYQVGTVADLAQPLVATWDTVANEDVDTADAAEVLRDWLSNQPVDETPKVARVRIWTSDEQDELVSEADTL